MDYFVPGISSADILGPSLKINKVVKTKEEANKAFISLFLSQILRNVLKSQNTLYGDSQGMSAFSRDMYNEILISKISEDLAKSKTFGFEKVLGLEKQMDPSSVMGVRRTI
ncbi:hypothetical protein ACFL4F_00040 [Candidatus Margulisiibacteriota bacterium]